MKIEVTGCRVLVKPYKLEEQDPAYARAIKLGIVFTDTDKRKQEVNVDRGHVLQIGEQAHQDYVGKVKKGDLIGYAKYAGKFFTLPDAPDDLYLVINDEDIICVFKE